MDIFKLVGSIFIDTEEANKSLKKTDEGAKSLGEKFKDGVKTAGKWAAGITAGAVAVGTAVLKSADAFAKQTDEIDKMSQRLGISRQAYQELDFALSQSGVDINSFQSGMKSLLKNMDAVTEGNKTATENFNKLGISVTNADGTLRTQEEVLFETIKAFQEMDDSAEKSRLAQEMFGKQGQEILPLLNSEGESIDELRQKAQDLGLVLSDDAIDSGVQFTDTMDQIKRAMSSLGANIMAELMPTIQKVLDWIVDHMPEIRAFVGQVVDFVKMAVKEITPIIEGLLPVIEGLFKFIQPLWERFLKPILMGIIEFLDGVFSGNWEKIFNGLATIVKKVFEGMIELVKMPINAIIKLLNKAIDGFNAIQIPDWVPLVGGKGLNIPQIPMLAEGGTIDKAGTVLVGERGPEFLNLPTGAKVTPLNKATEIDYDKLASAIAEQFSKINLTEVVKIVPDDRKLFRVVKDQAREYEETTGNFAF